MTSDIQNSTRVTEPGNRPFRFSFAPLTSSHLAAGGAWPWARLRNRCAAPIPPTPQPRRSETLSNPSPPPIPSSPWSISPICHLRWLRLLPHLPSTYAGTRRAGGSNGWRNFVPRALARTGPWKCLGGLGARRR